jgi:hypothetical protein
MHDQCPMSVGTSKHPTERDYPQAVGTTTRVVNFAQAVELEFSAPLGLIAPPYARTQTVGRTARRQATADYPFRGVFSGRSRRCRGSSKA